MVPTRYFLMDIRRSAIDRISTQLKDKKYWSRFCKQYTFLLKQFSEDNSFGQNSFDSLSIESEFLSKGGTNSFSLI